MQSNSLSKRSLTISPEGNAGTRSIEQSLTDTVKANQGQSATTQKTTERKTSELVDSASSSMIYPNTAHANREKEENIQKQKILTRLRDLDKEIKISKKNLIQAKKQEDHKLSENLQKKLESLYFERSDLRKKNRSQSKKSESSCNHSKELLTDYQQRLEIAIKHEKEKEAAALQRKIDEIKSSLGEDSNYADPAPVESSSPIPIFETGKSHADPIAAVESLLSDLVRDKGELIENIASLQKAGGNSDATDEAIKNIQITEGTIKTLDELLRQLKNGSRSDPTPETSPAHQSEPAASSTQPASKHPTRDLVRNLTARRQKNQDEPAPMKRSENPARNSTLYPREELHALLNPAEKNKVKGLSSATDELCDEIDELNDKKNIIKNSIASEDLPKKQKRPSEELDAINKALSSKYLKLNRIIKKTEVYENRHLDDSRPLSMKEKDDRYNALVEKFKSERTTALEKKYKDSLQNYIKENESGTTLLTMLSGAVANLSTFSIGSAVTRVLGGYGHPIPGAYTGAAVSGSLHAILTLPILKQGMRETWTSPALSEYNNYWKLVGASWGDWWRGEQTIAKYPSKNPQKLEPLNITERLAEEKDFWGEIFYNRFMVEELPYFSFMVNYVLKSWSAAQLPYLPLSASASTWIEGAMHLPMGWISGAETSLFIQKQRSGIPGAKKIPIPSSTIAAAEAEFLRSLVTDLTLAHTNLRTELKQNPSELSERELLKAIARTQKALASAERRSGFLGTLRQEIMAQFSNQDAILDSIAEIVARIVVLLPSSAVGHLAASWRNSANPLEVFLGYAIPAVLLILPPGWTGRPLVSGAVRAALQAFVNGRASDTKVSSQTLSTNTAKVPPAVKEVSLHGIAGNDESDVIVNVGDEISEDSSYDSSAFVTASSEDETSDDERSEDSSAVVSAPEGDETTDDEEWVGNAKPDYVGF